MAASPERDYSAMTETQVVAAAKEARRAADTARDQHLAEVGRACANLHARGWTWSRIGTEMGVNLTTAYRWSLPYLSERDPE